MWHEIILHLQSFLLANALLLLTLHVNANGKLKQKFEVTHQLINQSQEKK